VVIQYENAGDKSVALSQDARPAHSPPETPTVSVRHWSSPLAVVCQRAGCDAAQPLTSGRPGLLWFPEVRRNNPNDRTTLLAMRIRPLLSVGTVFVSCVLSTSAAVFTVINTN